MEFPGLIMIITCYNNYSAIIIIIGMAVLIFSYCDYCPYLSAAQKMTFSIKDFFSKYDHFY